MRESSATRCGFRSRYYTRLVPSARAPEFGSVDPVCPGLTAPGALPAGRAAAPPLNLAMSDAAAPCKSAGLQIPSSGSSPPLLVVSGPRPRSSWLLSPPPCLSCWPAANRRCFDALRCADRYSSTCLRVVEVPHLLPEATRTESPSSASELGCRPRLSAARLAPDCPDPPGERIPGVSYFGCSPASRASCSRRSPRGRTSDLGAPREPRVYRCTRSAAG